MVYTQSLIHIVAHIGIENRIGTVFYEVIYVAVYNFCGVANGVGGDGVLPFEIKLPIGQGRDQYIKTEGSEKCVPEGQKLIHIKSQWQADGLFAGDNERVHKVLQQRQLIVVNIKLVFLLFTRYRL